jgi:LacI family transcriptional regulator
MQIVLRIGEIMKNITIKDVAKNAGVSITIASFALNNVKGRVSEELRQKVLEVADKLGYIPNAAARNLRVKTSNTIAVVYDESFLDEKNSSTMQFISGVIKYANEKGKDTLVKLINCETGLKQAGEEYKKLWASQRVEGLILLVSEVNEEFLQKMTTQGINFVIIPPLKKLKEYNTVFIDNFSIMKKAIQYIYEKGYYEIYFLTLEMLDMTEREIGYKATREELGLRGSSLYYHSRFRGKREVWELIKQPIENRKGKIAITCWNDVDAISVIEVLQEQGIKVPEEVGVMGFDDIPASEHTYPPLTTIRQPFEQMAERAVDLLLENYENKEDVKIQTIEVPGYIVERKSI